MKNRDPVHRSGWEPKGNRQAENNENLVIVGRGGKYFIYNTRSSMNCNKQLKEPGN